MALVVFLRGVNVGGHRTFRPTELARRLRHLDPVNIGAAGTLVIRRKVARARLRAELARRLPFETVIAICDGREVQKLVARKPFGKAAARRDVVRFVSVLCGRPRSAPAMPMSLPASGRWLLQVVARDGPFVLGQYRRHLKAIGYLGDLDRYFGVPVTTRNWNTMTEIAEVLGGGAVANASRSR